VRNGAQPDEGPTFVSKLQRQARRSRTRVQGETDAFSQAMTFASGPVIFGLLGRFADSALGWSPVLLLVGIALGIFGSSATLYYRYQARMAHLDAPKPWNHVTHDNAASASRYDIEDTPLDTSSYSS
jgi:F0F1-type ATP synthase assembly protein I